MITTIFVYVCVKNYSFQDSTNEGFDLRMKAYNQRRAEEKLYKESDKNDSKDIMKARIHSKYFSKTKI